MTTDPVPDPVSSIPSPIQSAPPSATRPFDAGAAFRHWARILLARNPFYIISAALLLWSMRRLSLDSRIFPEEFPQLLFNFSSFQIYEVLLVVTAIGLGRRRVWYDSGLLVGLENLFMCVPFLLVSQALLLENLTAFSLCLAAGGLVVLRVGTQRRLLAGLNMPASLLGSGAFLLCFNFAWPVLIRYLHKDAAVPTWDARGLALTALAWNWIIPAAVALVGLLPVRPFATAARPDEELPFYSWRSFPLFALLMWVGGTGVHLYCIGYVYGLPWTMTFLTPAAWIMAWMLWRQVDNFASETARVLLRRIFLFPPTLMVMVAGWTGRWKMCLLLTVLNALICGVIAFFGRDRLARHLCLVSALLAILFMPHTTAVHGNVSMVRLLLGAGFTHIVGWAILSVRPRVGIAGGLCLGFGLATLLPASSVMLNLAIQAALMFMLLHSIRWEEAGSSDVVKARKLCGLCWWAHTVLWVAVEPGQAILGTMASGALVLGVYACARVILGKWGPKVIAYSAGTVVGWGPLFLGGERLLRAPDGLLMLLGSFALFGLGTFAALMKVRVAAGSKSRSC
jgi:hypothetical protein